MADISNKEGQLVPAPTTPRPEPVCFDDRQQTKVNEIIRQKQGEAAASVRRELNEKITELTDIKAKYDALVQEHETLKTSKGSAKSEEFENKLNQFNQEAQDEKVRNDAVVLELKQQLAVANENTVNVRKEVALSKAAEKCNFYSVSDAIALIQDSVKYDENKGRFYVVDEFGQERMNTTTFEPLTPEQYFSEFANKSPHLVKGTVRPGTNAGESQHLGSFGQPRLEELFGPDSDARKANELYKRDPSEYRSKKALARSKGLI